MYSAAASGIYGWLWIFSSSSVFFLLQTAPLVLPGSEIHFGSSAHY